MIDYDGLRFFQGSETNQIDINGNRPIFSFWYYEPSNYDGDILWSDGHETRAEALIAAEYDLSLVSETNNEIPTST